MKDNKIKESKNNEKEENKNWLPIGMCIGLCMGTAIGAAFSESKDKKD